MGGESEQALRSTERAIKMLCGIPQSLGNLIIISTFCKMWIPPGDPGEPQGIYFPHFAKCGIGRAGAYELIYFPHFANCGIWLRHFTILRLQGPQKLHT